MFLILGVTAAGFFPWPVEGLVSRFAGDLQAKTGWQMVVGQARWVPWFYLELQDLRLKTPQGGHLHLVKVQVQPRFRTLWRGALETQWEMGEIYIDPGSFWIQRPLAQELLSAGPVTEAGRAFLKVSSKGLTLRDLVLTGSLLRLSARGSIRRSSWADLKMEGQLAGRLLEGMNLHKTDGSDLETWEPFRIHLEGRLKNPNFSFASSFLSISWQAYQHQES